MMRQGKRSFSFSNGKMKSSSRTLSSRTGSSMRSLKSHSSQFALPTTTAITTDSPSGRGGGSQRSVGWGGGGALETGLHYGKLEDLLCARIPHYFKKIKSAQFLGLADISPHRQKALHGPAIIYLEDSLAAPESKEFAFDLLVDIHSSLGLLYELQGDSQTAIDYFMIALWLLHKPFKSGAAFCKGYDLNTQVAINLYRLGASYGKLGHKERMQETFDRAEWFREGDIFITALKP